MAKCPVQCPRRLDHIVHAARDLDAAAEFYFRAGIGKAG
jgi:hypothetical protein